MPRPALLLALTAALAVPATPSPAPAAVPDRPLCGTYAHGERILAAPVLDPSADAPRGDELVLRDAWGEPPNVRLSERFALKWGSWTDVSEEVAAELLEQLEIAREVEVIDAGLPDPTGWEGTYFNVYIGDTGPEVPSAKGAGGYYSWDDEGYPLIVLGIDTIENLSWAATVTAHEFFHAVQGATYAYYEWEFAYWWWEATATWAAAEVWPDDLAFASWLGAYASSPHLRLSALGDDGGAPPARQYGAFIFPRFLSEILGRADAVYGSWDIGTETSDPLDDLADLLGDDALRAAFADFAAHNVTWDYAHGELYAEIMEYFPSQWGLPDLSIVDLDYDDDGWGTVPGDVEPGKFAYNHVRVPFEALAAGAFDVRFEGDHDDFELRLVVESPSQGVVRAEVAPSLDGSPVELPDDASAAWLVVASVPDWGLWQSHSWSVAFATGGGPGDDDDDDVADDDDDDLADDDDDLAGDDDDDDSLRPGGFSAQGGCACDAAAGAQAPAGALILLFAAARRRSPRRTSPRSPSRSARRPWRASP